MYAPNDGQAREECFAQLRQELLQILQDRF
uniref:Uncharacterized protein n=1 Tax=Anguilla anguilla TaxID=7936 RepID=A0A0E9TYI7_ANGAN